MYFPYFRGKQEEVFAVQEALPKIAAGQRVFPVFEPVKPQVNQILRCAGLLQQFALPYAVIENPGIGPFAGAQPAVRAQVIDAACAKGTALRPALLVDSATPNHQVAEFLKHHANRPVVLVHKSSFRDTAMLKHLVDQAGNVEYHLFRVPGTTRGYRSVFPTAKSAIIEDHFARRARNADYAQADDESFTDDHQTFAGEGMAGFGDYLMVGDYWSDTGGGGAHAVTLHMTYPRKDRSRNLSSPVRRWCSAFTEQPSHSAAG